MKKVLIIIIWLFISTNNAQILFEDDASIAGLSNHTGQIGNGNGLSFVDYDDDGWDDITLPAGEDIPLRFYKNYQGFFVQETLLNELIKYPTRAVSWVDYDNDGDKDLFITSDTDGNRLFNNNNGSFNDVTLAAGLPLDDLETYGVSWGDVNNDGCLDFYLSNRVYQNVISNYLFKSNCDGTFFNATDTLGLSNTPALTFCSSFFDFNNDGWQDLYVSNDKSFPNFLYKNNGDGTFTDVSESSGTNIIVDAMSVTVGDFNNDGFFDIYITNTPVTSSTTTTAGAVLFKNNGDETFSNIAVSSGTEFNSWAWGANFLDAENDGDLDLYVSSSFMTIDGFPSYAFYENKGNENFSSPNNVGFLGNEFRSYGSASGDSNNDGKTDIAVINNFNSVPNLWNNKSQTDNNYLSITLEGTASNKDGIGAIIEISVSGNKQYKCVMNGESYLSQNSLKKNFGVGDNDIVDYVKVKWLSGIEDIVYDVSANQVLEITEGSFLSTNEFNHNDSLTYQNPVQESFEIESSSFINSITIYSIQGSDILYKNINAFNANVNLSFLKSGLYLVKLDLGIEPKFIKIIKN